MIGDALKPRRLPADAVRFAQDAVLEGNEHTQSTLKTADLSVVTISDD